MENRHELCVLFDVKPAVGAPEAKVAVAQVKELQQRGFNPKTIGSDRGYHTEYSVQRPREAGIVPHSARKAGRRLCAWSARRASGQPACPQTH